MNETKREEKPQEQQEELRQDPAKEEIFAEEEAKKKEPKKSRKQQKETDAKDKEIDALKAEVTTLKEELEQHKEQLLRNHAELQNFKRRMTDEKIKERKYANAEFAKALMPVLDAFDLALQKERDNEKIQSALKGFEIIRRDLMNILKDEGVTEIDPLDEPFDPNYHQAVMKEPKENVATNTVTEVFQKGYLYKDRLLRPAMVKVSE